MNRQILLAACIAMLMPGHALAETYAEARARVVTAYQAQDYSTMHDAARAAFAARPDHPGARFNLALAQALDGDPAAALATLHWLADAGVHFPAEGMDEFAALRERFTWPDYLFKIERLQRPHGTAIEAARFGPDDFIPEGILVNDADDILLGSIRHGRLLRWNDGDVDTVSTPEKNGHWSVFGMRKDDAGMIWLASAAVPQFAPLDSRDLGRSGLFRLDPRSGEVIDEMLLPDDGAEHVLGDLVIADDGLIYTTDSIGGGVYRYDPELRALHELVEPGVLVSPQGLVIARDGRHLLVADYATGLYRVALEDGAVSKLETDGRISVHGIDGLYRHGSELIAIQNGIRPHRVSRLSYDASKNRITKAEPLLMNHPAFAEPTLGQIVGNDFYLVANSQWNRFEADNTLPADGLASPVILLVPLNGEH